MVAQPNAFTTSFCDAPSHHPTAWRLRRSAQAAPRSQVNKQPLLAEETWSKNINITGRGPLARPNFSSATWLLMNRPSSTRSDPNHDEEESSSCSGLAREHDRDPVRASLLISSAATLWRDWPTPRCRAAASFRERECTRERRFGFGETDQAPVASHASAVSSASDFQMRDRAWDRAW